MRLSLPFLTILASSGAGHAQMFPPVPTSGTVYDGAHLLSPQDESSINALSQAFQKDTGAPIVVATLPSLDSVGAKSIGIEKYSSMLFNQWRIGRRDVNGGILLVVAKADRVVRIELGKDWRHDYDAVARRVRVETIIPAFKRGDFSAGIVRGCQGLAKLSATPVESNPGADTMGSPVPSMGSARDEDFSQPGAAFTPNSSGGDFPGGLVLLAVPVLFLIVIVAALFNRSRNGGGFSRPYGTGFGSNRTFTNDPNDDAAFIAGMAAGQAMSQPTYDPAPSYDSSSSDAGSGFDGSSSDSGSFDSGSSGGGGDTGSW